MPVIPDSCEFEVEPERVVLSTTKVGDSIGLNDITLNGEQAAALAYLLNQAETLHVEIRVPPA